MNKKLETWCYGGKTKAFFVSQIEIIHQYNTKMMDRLLVIMTIIVGGYLALSTWSGVLAQYFVVYPVWFVLMVSMLITFKLKKNKSALFTKIYMILFSCVIFTFVCILGTIFTPDSRASLFIVYVLGLPMLLVIPTHHMYVFLTIVTFIFSVMSFWVKNLEYAQLDIIHGITCLVIGIFISHHILESRMKLYELNEQLGTRNIQLDRQLQEKEKQLLQSRIAILLSQIQPHFLYNALTTICGLCDENPKEAKKITAEFADYLRHNLDTLNKNTSVPFLDELQHTKIYLSIEKKRFEEKLNVVYHIDAMGFFIPSLTVQPLVENAVKHGILKRKKGGTITISAKENADDYQITIEDDGIGFDPYQSMPESETHIGITNVRDRLWSICQGTLTIESEIDRGTRAIIKIPKGDTKR